ncbi:MAG: hypothetical protein DSY37_01310 [Hyperthermus sp.]|nr:MAG: hypothetical protein DSY37_01310 [Hyperthermus sp.]
MLVINGVVLAGRLLILRTFIDTGSLRGGQGYYSPIHVERECATLIPVPETRVKRRHRLLDPEAVGDPCTGMPLSHFMPRGGEWLIHNDPRLDLGFYTDYYAPRGRLPRRPGHRLSKGDVIGFAAGLAYYGDGFWETRRSMYEIRMEFKSAVKEGRAAIYLVGFIKVARIVDVGSVGWERAVREFPQLRESPHLLGAVEGGGDEGTIAVIGEGYIVRPPAPLSTPTDRLERQPPSRLLERLIERDNAVSFSRSNYRRTKLLRIPLGRLREVLSSEGYSIVPASSPG